MPIPTFAETRVLKAGPFELALEKERDDFAVNFSWNQPETGLLIISLKLTGPQPAKPGLYRLSWRVPLVDIHGFWRPGADRNRRSWS